MSLYLASDSEGERETPESTFYVASRLVPDGQEVVSVPPDTPVSDALALMKEHDFSQLPVLVEGEVIGVFSYRFFAQQVVELPKQENPLEMGVEDLLEPPRFARARSPLKEVLDILGHDGCVLIGDDHNLLAVVTGDDALSFLWGAAEPILLLQGIELAVRDLMRTACDSESALGECIARGMQSSNRLDKGELLKLEELSFGETINVLSNGDNYDTYFNRTFGQSRRFTRSKLEHVKNIRNQVVHFRSETTIEQIETLVTTQNWLHQKRATARHKR